MWTHTLLISNTSWGVQWCTRGRTAGVTPRLELSASSEILPASSWAEEDLPCTPEGRSGPQLQGKSTRNIFKDSSMKGNSREASSQSAVKIMRSGIKAVEHVCYITPSHSCLTLVVHLGFLLDVWVQFGNVGEVGVGFAAVGVGVTLCERKTLSKLCFSTLNYKRKSLESEIFEEKKMFRTSYFFIKKKMLVLVLSNWWLWFLTDQLIN